MSGPAISAEYLDMEGFDFDTRLLRAGCRRVLASPAFQPRCSGPYAHDGQTVMVTADEDAAELAAGSPENVTVSDRSVHPRHELSRMAASLKPTTTTPSMAGSPAVLVPAPAFCIVWNASIPDSLCSPCSSSSCSPDCTATLPAAVELAVAATPPDATRLLGQSVLSSLDHSSVPTPSTLPQGTPGRHRRSVPATSPEDASRRRRLHPCSAAATISAPTPSLCPMAASS